MATPTLAQQAAIANLYIALFNRAPDAAGFAFWTQALADGASIDVLARGFVQTPEAQAIYPVSQTAAQFVTTYYANVLGRPIDPSGLAFWTGILESSGGVDSTFARALVVSKIVDVVNTPLPVKPDGLTDAAYALTFADRNAFKNKVDISIFYATDYKGTDLNLAKQVLSVVGPASTTIDAAKALLNPPTGGGGGGGTPPVVGPQNFVGTTGVDNFVGGTADDTFTFVINTATPGITTLGKDTLTGAAGNDTLTVTTTGTVTNADFAVAAISGIETLALTRTAASSVTVTAWTGLSNVNVNGGNGNLLVEDLAGGAKVSLNGSSGGTVMMRYLNGATGDTTLALTGNVSGQGVEVQTTGLSSLTLTSTGSDNALANLGIGFSVSTLKIVADTALTVGAVVATKLNVEISGTATVNLATLTNASIKTIDASANSGGLTVALSSGEPTVTVKGSSGNDTISTGIALTTGSVDAGAGTGDRLIVTASAALSSSALGAKYTGFEILQVGNGASVDLTNITGITSVEIADGAGSTNVAVANTTQANAISILSANATGAIGIGAAAGIDTIKATVVTTLDGAAQAINLSGINIGATLSKLELTGNGAVGAAAGLLTLTTANARTLDSIVVKNGGAVNIAVSGTHKASNLSIDASASAGSVEIDASAYSTATGVTIKLGTGGSDVTGSAKADFFTGGSGADIITSAAGNDILVGGAGVDLLDGGAGNDYLLADGALSGVNIKEVQTISLSGTALNPGTYTLGNTSIALVGTESASEVAAAFTTGAGKTNFLAQNASIEDISYALDTFTITYKEWPGSVPLIAQNSSGAQDFNSGMAVQVTQGKAGLIAAAVARADFVTGSLGNDTFAFAQNSSVVTAFDTINDTELELGSNDLGGRVDTLVFQNADGVVSIADMTAQQGAVSAAGSLAAAVDLVLATANTDGATAQFTYGGGTYIVHNGDGNSVFDNASDFLVKVLGITGTLDASDIVLV